MKTTMLIVEFLVGGILVSLALAFFLFPDEVQVILSDPTVYQSLSVVVLLLSTIFIAIAYAVGIFFEPFARHTFEWLLHWVQRKRTGKYIDDLKMSGVDRTKDPILRSLKKNKELPTGLMRFYVLMKSPELYQDITSQLHRFRLMRILFVAEFFFILAIIRQLYRGVSSPLMVALVVLVGAAILNVAVVYDWFNRYCRSIEHSYYVLMLDKYGRIPASKQNIKEEPM